MDLTKEAIQQIQATAVAAAEAKILKSPDPRFALFCQNGDHMELSVPPALRSDRVLSLDSLLERAKTFPAGELWHNHDEVCLVYDAADRREIALFNLTPSDAQLAILSMDSAENGLSQRDLIRAMRFSLRVDAATIGRFRRLDWKVDTAATCIVERSRESLGKSIEAQVTGTADLPDELIVSVPLYDDPGERQEYTVRLMLDYDVQQQRIHCRPEAGELLAVLAAHQADIASRLKAAKLPTYYGTPTIRDNP
jgi:hypothetical protein